MAANVRSYNCKDEELPVICGFAAFSFKRDLADFTAFSPKFNPGYAEAFDGKITGVANLVAPESETLEKKRITRSLYETMDSLITPINRLGGYIDLANGSLNLSQADFGLPQLRKGLNSRDAENVIMNLHTVNGNITRYKESLTPQGLNEELITLFSTAETTVGTLKQQQYEITTNRKSIVQDNLSDCNELYDLLTEICKIGKILYKDTNPAKVQEYTFTDLKKQVSATRKGTDDTGNAPQAQ